MSMPLITVAISCFNAQDTISRAIASAKLQDWSNLEIIIVDDASTDNSVNVIKREISNDLRCKLVVCQANLGAAGVRNILLDQAAGAFIAFFDDDDESLSNRISEQFKTITQYERSTGNRLIACYASGVRKYSNGYIKQLPAIGSKGEVVPHGSGIADYLLFYKKQPEWFYGSGTPTCSLMARSTTFTALNGFDSSLRRVEDTDFAIRLALQGGFFVGTQRSCFIQYATNADDKSPERNLKFEQCLAKKHKEYLCSVGRYYYALHWPELRYWHFKRNYIRFFIIFTALFMHNPFAVLKHFISTAPSRLLHERKMRY